MVLQVAKHAGAHRHQFHVRPVGQAMDVFSGDFAGLAFESGQAEQRHEWPPFLFESKVMALEQDPFAGCERYLRGACVK
jgi:hypothetical protein